jgi:hypothetical protein
MEWSLQLNNEDDDASSIVLTLPTTNLPLEAFLDLLTTLDMQLSTILVRV